MSHSSRSGTHSSMTSFASTRSTQKELFQAAQQNDFQAVRDYLQVLLHESADENDNDTTEKPRDLRQHLVEPKTRNTLLHYACDNGNLDACKYLLMCDGMVDASLNEPNVFGHTPLFYAASSGQLPLVKWLISNGADIDTDYSDREDVTPRQGDLGIFAPLQIAAFKGYDGIVTFLVECNAALNASRRNGKTALHFACVQNHRAVVKTLLDAGADVHAIDDEGRTPVDVAPTALLPLLLPDEHACGDGDDGDDDDAIDADGGGDEDEGEDEHDDGFGATGDNRLAMEAVRAAFGREIARDFRKKAWKSRVSAINDASIRMQNGASGKGAVKLFDGASHMVALALQDVVSQVVSSSMGLLKSAFGAVMPSKEFHSAQFHEVRPVIWSIAESLLLRGAGSNEKDASEAVASLLFLISKSAQITRHLTNHIANITAATSAPSAPLSPAKPTTASDGSSSSNTVSWRLHLVSIKILNTITSQYRLDEAASGLGFQDAIRMSTMSLENASVHVRTAGIDLFVQCLLVRCEQSEMSGSTEAIYEQMKSWGEAIFKQHNQTLKPSIQAKINNGLKNALLKSKRLNGSGDRDMDGSGQASSTRKPSQNTSVVLDLAAVSSSAGAASPRSKGAQKEDDLPYAEPIQELNKNDAALIQSCFGEKVARCLFSNAWAPRVEALSFLQYQVESKRIVMDANESQAKVHEAMQNTLRQALQDRVNAVYEAGVALLMELAIAFNNSVSASPPASAAKEQAVIQDLVRPLIPRLLSKLGDSKARLHVTTEDVLLLISRQSSSLGPVYLLDEMIACDRNASTQSLSATYLSNKLSVISKLLLEFGVKEASDGKGQLPIKQVLQLALQIFEHRDPTVRHTAVQIIADALHTARAATMPFLDALARASRQKIIAKLVDKGVLESDLLMDEVDDFDLSTEPVRPGTSGGIRPPTASGSSTKHRPTLSNPSLSSTPLSVASASSSAIHAQAPALPYGTALSEEQKVTHAPIIECFGEAVARCLLDKAWAQREAAVREIERLVVCTANGKLSMEQALPKTVATLRMLSTTVELGLTDTVARVFQCTLRLCQVITTEFIPLLPRESSTSEEEDPIGDFLTRTVRAALLRFCDTKERLRSDCFTLLHALASADHVGQARMCRILVTTYQQLVDASTTAAASPLLATELFKLFTVLLRDGYAVAPSGTSTHKTHAKLSPILALMLPALANKHVDVRNAAIDTYVAMYELHQGSTTATEDEDEDDHLDLPGFLAQLKPAIREVITRRVVQINKPLPTTVDLVDGAMAPRDSARQQPLALDINKLRHVCSKEITDLLTSTSAMERCDGVDALIELFLKTPQHPQFKGAWEISCLLVKQLLLEGAPTVCLSAFQLLRVLVAPPLHEDACMAEFAIPWSEWGVHLIIGSTIRSVVQQSASRSVRVRSQVQDLLLLVAHTSLAGRNAVCNAILSAPEQKDISNEPCLQKRKLALCRLRWQMLLRLEVASALMLSVTDTNDGTGARSGSESGMLPRRKSSSSSSPLMSCASKSLASGDSLSIENIVPFLGSCAIHPSPLVRDTSRKLMEKLKKTREQELAKFIKDECSPSLQRRLRSLLTEYDGDDNNYADHFNAEDSTVVRGSRASHVRRVAALRPPRSVPVEERTLEVDVFPPPHSAPGKSRRSRHHTDDGDEEGAQDGLNDYVVQARSDREAARSSAASQNAPQVPIWLNANAKTPSSPAPRKMSRLEARSSRRDLVDESPEASQSVGGGAANLVKVRRRSSLGSNNGDDTGEDDSYADSRTPGKSRMR